MSIGVVQPWPPVTGEVSGMKRRGNNSRWIWLNWSEERRKEQRPSRTCSQEKDSETEVGPYATSELQRATLVRLVRQPGQQPNQRHRHRHVDSTNNGEMEGNVERRRFDCL